MSFELSNILDNNSDNIFLSFKANWCKPCKIIEPYINELSKMEQYKHISFINIDIDDNNEIVEYLDINSIPTFISFKNKNNIGNYTGIDKEQITNLINSL